MNERIKELAVQARNYALDEKRIYERIHNTEQCMEEYREVYNKKFAELIVKECIDTMYKRGETYAYPSAGFYQAKTFSEAIMKHFGVKE